MYLLKFRLLQVWTVFNCTSTCKGNSVRQKINILSSFQLIYKCTPMNMSHLRWGQLCKVFWSKRIGLVVCYCVKIARKMIKFYPPKSFLCPPNETLVINPSSPNHTSFQGSQSHFGAHSVEPLTSNSGFLKLNRTMLLWYWNHYYKLFCFALKRLILYLFEPFIFCNALISMSNIQLLFSAISMFRLYKKNPPPIVSTFVAPLKVWTLSKFRVLSQVVELKLEETENSTSLVLPFRKGPFESI